MKYITSKQTQWSEQPGYNRGVMMPYGIEGYDDVQVQVTDIHAGSTVGNHYHPKQTEFIYMLEGALTLKLEKGTITAEAGDLVVIEPGDVHAAANDGEITAKLLTVKVNGSPDDSVWMDEK